MSSHSNRPATIVRATVRRSQRLPRTPPHCLPCVSSNVTLSVAGDTVRPCGSATDGFPRATNAPASNSMRLPRRLSSDLFFERLAARWPAHRSWTRRCCRQPVGDQLVVTELARLGRPPQHLPSSPSAYRPPAWSRCYSTRASRPRRLSAGCSSKSSAFADFAQALMSERTMDALAAAYASGRAGGQNRNSGAATRSTGSGDYALGKEGRKEAPLHPEQITPEFSVTRLTSTGTSAKPPTTARPHHVWGGVGEAIRLDDADLDLSEGLTDRPRYQVRYIPPDSIAQQQDFSFAPVHYREGLRSRLAAVRRTSVTAIQVRRLVSAGCSR